MLSAMMIAAALGAHAAGEGAREEFILPRVEVRGPDGEWAVLGDPWRVGAFVVPITSMSALVPRAGVREKSRPGLPLEGVLRLEVEFGFVPGNGAGTFHETLSALVHGSDQEVLLVGGEARIFGSFRSPRSVACSTGADLAHVVRRDDIVVAGGRLVVTPPREGADQLLIFGATEAAHRSGFRGWTITVDGREHTLPAGATRPLVLDASTEPVVLEVGEALVDAVVFASAEEPVREIPVTTSELAQEDVRAAPEGTIEEFGWQPVIDLHKPKHISLLDWSGMGPHTDDDLVVPPGHRRLNRYHASSLQPLEAGQSITLLVRPNASGWGNDARKLHDEAPRLRDHAPRTVVRRPTVDLTKYTAIDSPESLVDATLEAGLGTYVHFEGPREQLDIRPTMGPGAAWGDVNGDGWLDLVLLQGGGRGGCDPLADRLFLSDGDGTFTDATKTAGLGRGDAGMGALLIDIDGDADLDLYCANYGRDRLFLGAGDGTFAEAKGLLPDLDLWSASVTAADPDGDGDLDLYITSYLDYDPEKMPPADELGRYQREDPVEMLPFAFPGQRNVYLRNTLAGSGTLGFEDVTEQLGLLDVQGRGMQTVFWDFDRDGDEDLYIANDVSFNVLFRNEGDGTFKDVSFSTGLDDPRGGMGLAVGDIDADGDEDVFLTNWQLEANALYLNGIVSNSTRKRRRASFHDTTVKSGIGPSGIGKTSWGAEFFDLELDGDLDLYVANGYTSPDYESTGICVGQTDQLFVGDGTGKLKEACILGRRAFSLAFASRGAIGADHDRDGDVDILVTANNGRATLLRNDAKRRGRWLGVRLSQPGLNRNAIGAAVTVTTNDGHARRQTLRAGTGYLTGNAPELHFGLGPVDAITQVQIEWPDGETTTHPSAIDTWTTFTR